MIIRLVTQTLSFVFVLGVILMLPAGTWHWPQAWVFLVEVAVSSLAVSLWLLRHDPALLEERLKLTHHDQAPWDRAFLAAACILFVAWLALIGLDIRHFGLPQFSPLAQTCGALTIAGAMLVVWWTFKTNSFAVPQVRIQTERFHKVISDGPYAYIRHPMYAGAVLFFLGTPLLLGSWWGLDVVPILTAGLGWRLLGEEAVLRRDLPGYEAYTADVTFRLIPGVW